MEEFSKQFALGRGARGMPHPFCGWLLFCAAMLYAFVHTADHLEYLREDAWLNDDTRQHFTVFVAQRHPEAFQDRLLVTYTREYLPAGYHALMSGLSRWMEPLDASKWLGFGLVLLTLAATAAVGFRLAGPWGAGTATVLLLRSALFDAHVYGGLFRSFAPLLCVITFWLLW